MTIPFPGCNGVSRMARETSSHSTDFPPVSPTALVWAITAARSTPTANPPTNLNDEFSRAQVPHLGTPIDSRIRLEYHTCMASKTTVNFDDEMEAALTELVAMDGTKKLAIKRSLIAEVKRRRRSQAMLDMIASWEADEGPIVHEHLAWADAVLDRQGVRR